MSSDSRRDRILDCEEDDTLRVSVPFSPKVEYFSSFAQSM